MKTYYCPKCKTSHDIASDIGAHHLPHVLSKEDLGKALNFSATAGAYAYIENNTQQYLRDVQVFDLLGDKFPKSGHFEGTESVQNWVTERLSVGPQSNEMLYRFFQGHGAGEVDAVRHMNGRLSSLLYRAEFPRDTLGHVDPSTPGYDFQIVNRFTGEIVEKVQVKANWSSNPAAWKATLDKMLASDHYSPDHTLVLPKEVADLAKEMGIENKIVVVSDVEGNRVSAERLTEMARNGEIATEGAITLQGVAERVGQGAIVGAAVAFSISAIGNYLAYRRGDITGKEAFKRIGIDASKGAIVGGTLGGLSLLFPPGAIGIGIGIAVGMQIRRLVDIAYGKGAYEDILHSMGAVEASIEVTATGVTTIAKSTSYAQLAQKHTIGVLDGFAASVRSTNQMLERLDEFKKGGNR